MIMLFAILSVCGAQAKIGQAPISTESRVDVAAPSPLSGRSREQICKSDALLLIKHPISALENTGWTQFCCGDNPVFEGGRCEIDWPSSDVPGCELWDEMRNQIYARHGYPFKGERWRKWAKDQPWYERREDFQENWLSDTARANVAILKRYAATQHHCLGK